ncbi:MAG TPA: cation transporting ATPase C-terminal domain-containing protein [Mycobacterium sp.]|nr:cation transporting ATPase C-terminal domain-containing protein [Mycobacterium sp.]HTX98195.1 cation transporting ATPase C-terminal domain-containing protein [Mycobacterium sp.]
MFGPISSLFDLLTFGLMLGVLHGGEVEFYTGWFLESLATQTLIVFAIRTRTVCRSCAVDPALLTAMVLSVVAVGLILTVVPFGRKLGFPRCRGNEANLLQRADAGVSVSQTVPMAADIASRI